MQVEQVKPNKPSFGVVVLLAAVALLVIVIGAVIVVGWRAHKKNTPPYTKHPVSRLEIPALDTRGLPA